MESCHLGNCYLGKCTVGKLPLFLHGEVATWEVFIWKNVHFGSCRLGNCTFGKFPLGKIPLGSCRLGKYLNQNYRFNFFNELALNNWAVNLHFNLTPILLGLFLRVKTPFLNCVPFRALLTLSENFASPPSSLESGMTNDHDCGPSFIKSIEKNTKIFLRRFVHLF